MGSGDRLDALVGDSGLELISRCLGGDARAFEELYAAYAGRVAGYFLRSGFRPADADDLTQETFVRAFRSLDTYDERRGSFPLWLSAIAKNVARRSWSRRAEAEGFDPELAEEMFAAPENPSQTPEAREETGAVRDCVSVLPAELGGIVRLRYIEGKTTRGIAAFTGIPEATVRLRLKEAQALLEQCLKGKGFLK